MRFKRLGAEIVVLLVASVFIMYLALKGQLNLYIHPRYIVFTAVMSGLGLVILLVNAASQKSTHTHKESQLSSLPLYAVLALAILIPARSLSSATVSQRSIDSGSIVTTSGAKPVDSLFAGSSKGLKLADWSRLIQTNSDPSYYTNKPAKVSGFVYDAGLGGDTVWLARFVLTCCAVDAQPVGVPVSINGWQDTYGEDEWLEVEGQFEEMSVGGETQLILIPESVKSIEQPRNPYAS